VQKSSMDGPLWLDCVTQALASIAKQCPSPTYPCPLALYRSFASLPCCKAQFATCVYPAECLPALVLRRLKPNALR
jgi:hypothetical protein